MPVIEEKKDAPVIHKDMRDLLPGARIYELRFKKGLMTTTHFQAKDKQEAIEMGRTFCEKIKATFCGVDDYLVDLVEYADKKNRGDI